MTVVFQPRQYSLFSGYKRTMALDPRVGELRDLVLGDDEEMQKRGLAGLAELLDVASERWRTGTPGVLANEEARAVVRSAVVEYIDRGPTRPAVATAIWVLGKLYDSSLEPYLAGLAAQFLTDDRLTSHLRQTVVALDNVGALDSLRLENFPNDIPDLRKAVASYLGMG